MIPKAIFNWSSGKDSALALYKVLQKNQFEVLSLCTTISAESKRISMHGVREELLTLQAKSLDLPLKMIELPSSPTGEEYNSIMNQVLSELQEKAITHSIFGDIFLEDLRAYRENKLKQLGLSAVFPLWKQNTTELIYEFIDLDFKTIVTCIDESVLTSDFLGRIIDKEFIADLPKNVDPCGENGEFHTFTFDGPIFKFPIEFEIGDIIRKTYPNPSNINDEKKEMGFLYCDLIAQ